MPSIAPLSGRPGAPSDTGPTPPTAPRPQAQPGVAQRTAPAATPIAAPPRAPLPAATQVPRAAPVIAQSVPTNTRVPSVAQRPPQAPQVAVPSPSAPVRAHTLAAPPSLGPVGSQSPASTPQRANLLATPPSIAGVAKLPPPANAPRTPPPSLVPDLGRVSAPVAAPASRPPLLDAEPVTSVGVPIARPTAARPALRAAAPAAAKAGHELPEGLDMAQLQDLSERASSLNRLDYFELLRLPHTASPAEIKQAFYRESRTFHPDRFFQVSNPTLKAHVHELYKRLAEGYGVLRDDRRRHQYLSDIQGPDRARKLRFTEASEAENKAAVKRQSEEQIGTTPRGRQFFLSAQADETAGRLPSAERNLKMALTFEPQNERYKERLRAVQDAIEAERRSRL